uniref:Lipopolysaccharide-responsive and beige-like anchor protein n=1 Tax=Lygus hesperus TaxID=30085 RepID=A0A0A9ZII1_LYGHE
MYCLTGVTYVSREEAATLQQQGNISTAESPNTRSAIVKEGDFVTGTVSGVRGGALAGIRLTTSRGLRAFIAAADIEEEALRVELLEYVSYLEQVHEARLQARHGNNNQGYDSHTTQPGSLSLPPRQSPP